MLNSNEYFIDTCCSLNENERIYLSCNINEKIHLNLIEIYYNSDEYCSSELYCCKYRTKCSRRITKYSNLNCDKKNSCWIDKTCLKIYEPCASIYGLYGQYITINYSCLPLTDSYDIINQTDYLNNYQPVPFIVKLLTSEEQITTTNKNIIIKKSLLKNFLFPNDYKSSPIFLIFIIFIFLLIMFIIYWFADIIGKKICRQKHLNNTQIFVDHSKENKINVESNPSLPITRIYPSQYHQPYYHRTKYRYNPYSFYPYQRYISVEHDPTTGQIYSRTFNDTFNYYQE